MPQRNNEEALLSNSSKHVKWTLFPKRFMMNNWRILRAFKFIAVSGAEVATFRLLTLR